MPSTKSKGDKGEDIAVDYLVKKGFKIVERNYRYGHGEIDIIAEDPDDGYLVFVEVKRRRSLEYGAPEFAITIGKTKQLSKMAELYLYDKEIKERDCRIDAIIILDLPGSKPEISHFKNITL